MTKYPFDRRVHLFTRLSVVAIIAPYMIWRGLQKNEDLLTITGIVVLLFDFWTLFIHKEDTTKVDKRWSVHTFSRLAALVIQVPIMAWYAKKYDDFIMGILALGTLVADLATFIKGI